VPVGAIKTAYNCNQNRTYITIRIHKHNNKNTKLTKLNKSIKNIQPYMHDKKHVKQLSITVVLYGCEGWGFILRKQYQLQECGNKLLRKIP